MNDGISRVARRARGLAGRNQIGSDRRARQKPASERFGVIDRTPRHRCGGQRLALERLGGHAQPVLYQANAVIKLSGPSLAPQRDLGDAMIEGLQHALADPRVASEEIRRRGQEVEH